MVRGARRSRAATSWTSSRRSIRLLLSPLDSSTPQQVTDSRRLSVVDRKRYELECLIRRPKYRSDREQFYRELPRLQDPSQWDKDDQGRSGFIPTDDERRVWKAFGKQYPERGMDHTSFVVEPYPLTYDPAWKVAVDRAVDNFYRRHHRMPQGLVTRAAIDDSTPRPECEEIYAEARRLFNAMSEWQRGGDGSSGEVISIAASSSGPSDRGRPGRGASAYRSIEQTRRSQRRGDPRLLLVLV